ncbi:MAG: hypothetical protein ACETWT_01425 [Thermodesulfobacteriota bacterium]
MWDEIIQTLSGLLVPFIGITTTYIAIKQYHLAKMGIRKELLDRRLGVFKATMEFIPHVMSRRGVEFEKLQNFNRETADSFFLFKEDIQTYIDDIYKKGSDYHAIGRKLDGDVVEKRTQQVEKASDLGEWFSRQFNVARQKFKPYLSVV